MNQRPPVPLSATLQSAILSLLARRRSDGGFSEQPGGDYRPDATAWAALCLNSFHAYPDIVAAARAKLCTSQLADGSIPITPDYPEAFWPTAVASLALADASEFSVAHSNTIKFLLASGGEKLSKEPDSPIGHDTSIQGWSWVARTHSWIEPTAMTIRALSAAGYTKHKRVQEGVRLLLDRQLPNGGWNCGATIIYGKVLNSLPTSTGMALWSLAGLIAPEQITISLNSLKEQLPRIHTPLSLGWALHGLTAWNIAIPKTDDLIAECLRGQDRYSSYGTFHLCVLLTTANALKPTENGHA